MIYESGCISTAEAWIDKNMIPVAGTAVGIAVVEVITSLLCVGQTYSNEIC